MSGAGRRGRRAEDLGGRRWLVVEAWRAGSGHRLAYFLPLASGGPAPDDRADRRALLEPGRDLASLGRGELETLLGAAAPLTPTERRIRGTDDEPWLVQSAGPVWAVGGVAEGLTGFVFTRLDGSFERRTAAGEGVSGLTEAELRARLAAARDDA